jgi:hypothetical protein
MTDKTKELDDFLNIALNSLNLNNNNESGFFEKPLIDIGKGLDNILNSFSFLLDGNWDNLENNYGSEQFTTINEINMVFNKSQFLYPPNQFSNLLLTRNIYIENPKPGDWFRFNVNNIEEGLINLKDKNEQDPDKVFKNKYIVTQKFPK